MIEEEMELIQLKEKSEQINTNKLYIRKTDHTSKKGSIVNQTEQHRESFKNRWFSNTEKDYDCLINVKNIANNVVEENVNSRGFNNHHQSFSFDNNDVSNNKVQDQNIALNKSNYLTYDKKVKAFNNIKPDYDSYIENAKLQSQNSKKSINQNSNERIQVVSPQPQVSKESFNKMTRYVNNSFRKEKMTGRKNSNYTFSSHSRKDQFKDTLGNSLQRKGKHTSKSEIKPYWYLILDGIKSERPFSVKSNNSSSQREGFAGVLSCDSISVASMGKQEINLSSIMAKNKEFKEELHKSRKNNATLRLRITKYQKETNDLRNDKLEMLNKIEKLEKARDQDKHYIAQQEKEIHNLHQQLRNQNKNILEDPEKVELRNTLDKVIEVKMKYEKIIKACSKYSCHIECLFP